MLYFVDMDTSSPALTPSDVLGQIARTSPVPRGVRHTLPFHVSVYVSNGTLGFWQCWASFETYKEQCAAAAKMRNAGFKVLP